MMDAIKGDAQVDDQLTFNQLIGDWALALPSPLFTPRPAFTSCMTLLHAHMTRLLFLHAS